MKWNRLWILFPAVAAILALWSLPALAAGDTLVVATTSDAKTLDPHESPDGASAHIMVQIYETLVKVGPGGQIEPSLAEKVERIDDLSYRFTLRRGVKFHNGEELKASDVKYTFERKAAIGKINYVLGNIDLAKTEVVDDSMIIIRTKVPDTSFLAHLTHWGGGCILNEKATKAAGQDFGTHPVGTGPYEFVSWPKGDRIVLKRFDGYRGKKSAIPNIVVRTITEATNRVIELEAGGVDISYAILPIDLSKVQSNPKLRLLRTPDAVVQYMGFNLSKKPFDDIRVRQAIAHAIDVEKMVKVIFRGVGGVPKSVFAPSVKYYDPNMPTYPCDPEKAKALLAEAGYKDGFRFTILTADRKERIDMATVIQNQLKKVGIEVGVNVMEWGAFQEKLKDRTHEVYLNSWTTAVPDPDYSVFGPFHSSQARIGLNRSMVVEKDIDDLIEKGRVTPEGAERGAIYSSIQKRIAELEPWLLLHNGEQLVGTQKYVKGFSPDPGSYHVLHTVYFEE